VEPADGLPSCGTDRTHSRCGGTGAFEYVERAITAQAMTLGVNDVFHVLGWMYLLLMPFLWFAKPPFAARGTDTAH